MEPTLRVLILGGTGDAAALAQALAADERVSITSSLAGRVARPALPIGKVRVGGFGGAAGLAAYLRAERIDAVIDATHPFAARISANAADACTRTGLPLIALERAAWAPLAADRWHAVNDASAAAQLAPALGRRIFLTTGRQDLAAFAACGTCWFLIRTIDPPHGPLPPASELIIGRGPFRLADEIALMRAYGIDLVVSKNSGGSATYAKIEAARALGIPIVMIERPARPPVHGVASIAAVVEWTAARCTNAQAGAPVRP